MSSNTFTLFTRPSTWAKRGEKILKFGLIANIKNLNLSTNNNHKKCLVSVSNTGVQLERRWDPCSNHEMYASR